MSRTVGDGYSTYADSTLMTINKKELISIIRCLEHNLRGVKKENDRQYKMLTEQEELGGFLDGYEKGRNDAIDDVIHWVHEAIMNNLKHPQFCRGLEKAIEIAKIHRQEVE